MSILNPIAAIFQLTVLAATGPFSAIAQEQGVMYNCGSDIAIPPLDLKQYFRAQLRYPPEAEKEGIQGRVYVSFTVDTSGMMHHFSVVKGKELGYGLPEEALRLVQSIPGQWQPATKGDLPMPCTYTVPVIFLLE